MIKNFLHIPIGIRLISWATATRFVGWGLVEIFVPVFLLSFATSFTEAGLLKSSYDIVFLLALPVVGRLADRLSSKRIILSGLVLYPFIALAYYFAGVYGAIGFIILARAMNGVSFALDSVGKKTYMRRHAHGHVGMVFGYFDTISNFWLLAASAASLIAIKYFEIHELFLFIIPTTLVAIFLVSLIPHERKERQPAHRSLLKEVWLDYKQVFTFIRNWTFDQKYIALLYAFMGSLFIVIIFFIPLVYFKETHSYNTIFLLMAFAMLPLLFGVPLGLLADRATKKTLQIAIFAGVALLAILPFVGAFWMVLLMIFAVSVCIYYGTLVLERCATAHESRAHMGSLSGAFLCVFQAAQVASPIIMGFLIDLTSFPVMLIVLFSIGLMMILPLAAQDTKIFDVV